MKENTASKLENVPGGSNVKNPLARQEPQACGFDPWVRKQLLETDMEQRTGSKLGKECNNTACCHLAYLTSMQSTLCEMPGWMKHRQEPRLSGEISTASDMQMIPLKWQKVQRN